MKTLALVLVLACVTTATAQQAAVVLRPGDVLRVTVMRHPELSGEFIIDADGTLIHPVYREVIVTNIAQAELERRVHELLARFESRPEFVVDALYQIAVGGEVRQPNLYALRPTTTIAQAVALAGGATDRGRLDRVRLFRSGAEHVIDLTRPEIGMGSEPIRSGDQILVSRRSSVFRDYIAPAASLIGALAAVLNYATR